MPHTLPPVLVWIRIGDLRLHDNPALSHAALTQQPVLVLFIYENKENRGQTEESGQMFGQATKVWLEASLSSFIAQLQKDGFGTCIRQGTTLSILEKIIKETNAKQLFWNRKYDPYSVSLEQSIQNALNKQKIIIHSFPGNVLCEPDTLYNKSNKPYQVFSQFWKSFTTRDIIFSEETVYHKPAIAYEKHSIPSCALSSLHLSPKNLSWPKQVLSFWTVGENAALKNVSHFLHASSDQYAKNRNIPSHETGTSRLSPYLHFGEISIRTMWNKIVTGTSLSHKLSSPSGVEHYLRELGWREFANYLLYHFPHIVHSPLKTNFEKFPFRQNPHELHAWQRGKTGVPIIDAGIRQLWQTGWMHNRVRLIVSSYLVKHLLHSWKEGVDWFWDTLFDANIANNTLGWQWICGCGADAAPYFRIFNPVLQSKKFDPDGEYIKKYVPELASIPTKYIHNPWNASSSDLALWKVELGKTYPYPLIDLHEGRLRALKAFSSIKTAKKTKKSD